TSAATRAVANAEDVARVDGTLRGSDQLEAGRGMYLRQERLADLADTVVMRERSAAVEHHLPQRVLDLLEGGGRVGETAPGEPHGEVDADTGMVGLRHAVGEIRRAGHAARRAFGGERALDGGAHALDPVPRYRRLEGFADEAVLAHEVAD